MAGFIDETNKTIHADTSCPACMLQAREKGYSVKTLQSKLCPAHRYHLFNTLSEPRQIVFWLKFLSVD